MRSLTTRGAATPTGSIADWQSRFKIRLLSPQAAKCPTSWDSRWPCCPVLQRKWRCLVHVIDLRRLDLPLLAPLLPDVGQRRPQRERPLDPRGHLHCGFVTSFHRLKAASAVSTCGLAAASNLSLVKQKVCCCPKGTQQNGSKAEGAPSGVLICATNVRTFRTGSQSARPCPHTSVFSSMMPCTQHSRNTCRVERTTDERISCSAVFWTGQFCQDDRRIISCCDEKERKTGRVVLPGQSAECCDPPAAGRAPAAQTCDRGSTRCSSLWLPARSPPPVARSGCTCCKKAVAESAAHASSVSQGGLHGKSIRPCRHHRILHLALQCRCTAHLWPPGGLGGGCRCALLSAATGGPPADWPAFFTTLFTTLFFGWSSAPAAAGAAAAPACRGSDMLSLCWAD